MREKSTDFRLQLIMGLANLLNFFMPMSAAIDPNCDFSQDMVMGTEYYIYNSEYPKLYGPSISCRWSAKSPEGTSIIMTCDDISIPESPNCQSDHLSVSLSGDPDLQDGIKYCLQNATTVISQSNTLTVGLFSAANTPGGRFVCALTAMQVAPPSTTTARPNTCDCGWRHQTRIVGGQDTGVNEFPYMCAIIDVNTYDAYCGGTIISERYVLTAAHCLNRKNASDLGLLVGDHDLSTGNDTAAAALYKVADFVQHPDYDESTQQNDIGIIMTATSITFSTYVGPVCLPFRYTWTDFYAQTVTVLGWGFLDFSGNKSEILQKVDLSIISNTECVSKIPDPVTDRQICTYAEDKDSCLSDSGGPLLWQDAKSNKLHLIGVISYGIGCATVKPAVNTRVTSYLPWIISMTTDAVYCIK